ncbi:MAG: peptidoglycan-binding protein [Phycisphaerales bacterium]|nr:peptidoglycan-binding protein [Phycisphaerales bacterium]
MPIEHHVSSGECINSIAMQYGFFPDTLWEHGSNAELKEARKDPNVLQEGDIVHVPDLQERHETCSVEKKHRFRRKGVPSIFKLQLMNDGEPRANLDYTIDFDGDVVSGKTDSEGKIEHPIAPDTQTALLKIPSTGEVYKLNLGHLDPLETTKGGKQRLRGLGYYKGAIDEEVSDDFKESVKGFQADYDMEPSGEYDGATADKLKSAFGS